VFENIIEQGAVLQLRDDIKNRRAAPSMLFFGPSNCGKGSAALELARVLSCEENATWKCTCYSCERHRVLGHDDLLVFGRNSFAAEITACQKAFLRAPFNQGVKLLFFRSLRKLMLRFSPVLLEDEPKLGKIAPILQSLDERSSELFVSTQTDVSAALEKFCASLVKDAITLEDEGLSNIIPVRYIRNASFWCNLSPNGKRKTLIIENAENMREEGRNSLLKLLEEPPASVSIVLTAQRKQALIPTILSRLRPYRFLKRSVESEKEVIRRVFQDEGSNISEYLESFLPKGAEKLYPLAAWFIVSLARVVSISRKKTGASDINVVLNTLGERYAPIAEKAGLEKCLKSAQIIKTITMNSNNFENDSFSRFLQICLEMISEATRCAQDPLFIVYNDIFKKHINETVTAVDVLNINVTIALESLFYNLKKDMVRG